jgi:hypothetical protein
VDITYYDSGYIDPNYYVYTADAFVDLGQFIVEDYLEPDYFENTGLRITLTCEATKLRVVEAAADLVVNFSQSVNGVIDVRAEVTLSTIVSLSSQEIRVREFNSDLVTEFTHTAAVSATFSPQVSFSSIASQLTAAFQNATGTITMETLVTVTALVGVIREFPLNQITGLGATSTQDGEIGFNESLFPPPSTGNIFTVRTNQWTFSVWVKRDTITGEYQCIAEGLVIEQLGAFPADQYNGGIVLKNSDVRIRTNFDAGAGGGKWSSVAPTDSDWHHYLFRTGTPNEGVVQRWNLWIDGIYRGLSSANQTSPSSGNLQFAGRYGSGTGTLYGGLRLGFGTIVGEDGSGGDSGNLLGGIAQVWMGTTTDDQFRVERFYSGLLDMGEEGTSTGLPTPVFYNKLTTPYTGVTWNIGATPVPSLASAPLILPSLPAQFSFTAESQTVLEVTANLQLVSSLTVTATKNVDVAATLSTEFTTATDNQTLKLATATLSTESQLDCLVTVQRSSAVELTASSTVTIDLTRIFAGTADLSSAFTATATVGEVTEFNISLQSEFTQATDISRTRNLVSALDSVSTVTAQIDDRLRDQSVSLESAVTLTVTYTRIPAISATLTSEFVLSAEAEKTVVAFGTLSVIFTQTSTAFKVVIAQANLVVEAFELTQGDILNFDPCREIAVESETRAAKILPESRLLIVESETRTLKVPQETRVLRVDYETRVNTIKC